MLYYLSQHLLILLLAQHFRQLPLALLVAYLSVAELLAVAHYRFHLSVYSAVEYHETLHHLALIYVLAFYDQPYQIYENVCPVSHIPRSSILHHYMHLALLQKLVLCPITLCNSFTFFASTIELLNQLSFSVFGFIFCKAEANGFLSS